MTHYIDKDALLEEINRLDALYHTSKSLGGELFIEKLFSFIDTIEVKEINEELAEAYISAFDKKFPTLPNLKGKQLADYKNFLNKCQQVFGLKEWGIRPLQAKLFEKLTLLWAVWGKEHLTLEAKKVDLKKEYKMFIDHDNGRSMFETAKYFFELGLKAKQTSEEIKIGETQIYLNDDGGEPPYDGKQWLDLSCTEYEIPEDKFKDGDDVELIIRKTQKGE